MQKTGRQWAMFPNSSNRLLGASLEDARNSLSSKEKFNKRHKRVVKLKLSLNMLSNLK
jgi:hypothetical protein